MKDPLSVSPRKGNQGTTRGKEKILLTSVETNPEVVDSIPTEVKRVFFFTSCGSLIPFTGAKAQWGFHGRLHIAF